VGDWWVTAAALDVLRGGHAGTWPEVRRYTTTRMRARFVEGAGHPGASPHVSVRIAVSRDACGEDDAPRCRTVRKRAFRTRPPVPIRTAEMQVPSAPINTALTWMLSGEAALSRHIPDAGWKFRAGCLRRSRVDGSVRL
jgi:hypothetical protein